MDMRPGLALLVTTESCTSQFTQTGDTKLKRSTLQLNDILNRRTLEVLGLAGFSKELARPSL